jgi:hypothetical protein
MQSHLVASLLAPTFPTPVCREEEAGRGVLWWEWGGLRAQPLILDDVNFDICLCARLLGVVDASLVAVTSNNLF